MIDKYFIIEALDKYGYEFNGNTEEDIVLRPWGGYANLSDKKDNSGRIVQLEKLIMISPGESISLQHHNFREEYWKILSGSGRVEIANRTHLALVSSRFKIPIGTIHRATASEKGLDFYEVQKGESCGEDDIVRHEDNYGRVA
ncbi:MAG: phosphomannose isomerase type II C-terminal cupin domain [Candidatus Pacearchaeota archaeon]